MFYVGQKVEFVGCQMGWRHALKKLFYPYDVPQKNTPYTVSNVYADDDGDCCVELLEFPSPETEQWAAGFISRSLRPLTDTSQSVSFTTGAPRDSRKWDNRRKQKERV